MHAYLRARSRNIACSEPRPQPRPSDRLSHPLSCRSPQHASASALPARTPPPPPPSASACSLTPCLVNCLAKARRNSPATRVGNAPRPPGLCCTNSLSSVPLSHSEPETSRCRPSHTSSIKLSTLVDHNAPLLPVRPQGRRGKAAHRGVTPCGPPPEITLRTAHPKI